MGELAGQSYLALDWGDDAGDVGDLDFVAMMTSDAVDLVESHWRVTARDATRHVQRLQAAVDRAHGALVSSSYVGGPSEREAWQAALQALGEVVTQHQGVNPDVE